MADEPVADATVAVADDDDDPPVEHFDAPAEPAAAPLAAAADEDDEFDDFKLDIVALAANAGGRGDQRPCCQEEPNDEPWGPRDATHAKGFFGGSTQSA